jgi:hypothetical protein
VNLILEGFIDPSFIEAIKSAKQNHNMSIGVFLTELQVGKKFWLPKSHIAPESRISYSQYESTRAVILNETLCYADFAWSFLERTAEEYKDVVDVCEHFILGSTLDIELDYSQAPKDIDAVFCGLVTLYRHTILEAFAAAGLKVVAVGQGTQIGRIPTVTYNSLLERAKIGLSLTFDGPPSPSINAGLDTRFGSCSRLPEFLENQVCVLSEHIPLDNPYGPFTIQGAADDLANMCATLLKDEGVTNLGMANANAWRKQMDVRLVTKPIIDRTLELLKI